MPFNWDGATGPFSDSSDWVGNMVPGPTDTAGFPSGGTLEGTGTVQAVEVSSDTTFAGTLTAGYGGTIDGGGAGTPFVLTLASGATFDLGGLFIVGASAAAAVAIDADATLVDTSFIDLGQRAFSGGAMSVAGLLLDNGALNVGEEGTGSLDIAGDGSVSAAFAVLGDVVGSTGTVTVEQGGTMSLGSMVIGNYGGGLLTIASGGTVIDSSFAAIGDSDEGVSPGGSAGVGGTWSIAASLNVGAGASGTLSIGAGASVSVGSFLAVGSNGLNGDGTVTVSDGGTLSLDNTDPDMVTVSLGQPGGVGHLTVQGPQTSLTAGGGGVIVGDGGYGYLSVLDGAALSVTNAAPDQFAAMYVGVTGGSGGLDVSGNGSRVTVGAGGLFVGFSTTAGVYGTGNATVLDGGTLSVTDTLRGLEIGAFAGGSGQVTVDGTASVLDTTLLTVGGTPTQAGDFGLLVLSDGAVANVTTAATIWGGSTIALDGGTLDTASLTNAGGTLEGGGTITGAVINDAVIDVDELVGAVGVRIRSGERWRDQC